ncbi:MAG TPA: 30S ribosomal protein S20 [Kofleriaceae bacterium]|nr:30S ribosomal protein S20 [Kofleriaceae bacterium]
MANNPSAEKRNRQMIKRRARNKAAMSALRTAVKKARAAIDTQAQNAADLKKEAISKIDKAVSKGVLKRETASRYVSRLATRTAAA